MRKIALIEVGWIFRGDDFKQEGQHLLPIMYCLSTGILVDLHLLTLIKLSLKTAIFGGNRYVLSMSWIQILLKNSY